MYSKGEITIQYTIIFFPLTIHNMVQEQTGWQLSFILRPSQAPFLRSRIHRCSQIHCPKLPSAFIANISSSITDKSQSIILNRRHPPSLICPSSTNHSEPRPASHSSLMDVLNQDSHLSLIDYTQSLIDYTFQDSHSAIIGQPS